MPEASTAAFSSMRRTGCRATRSRTILHLGRGNEGTGWGHTLSIRADLKLAPSMARPNLFSGD